MTELRVGILVTDGLSINAYRQLIVAAGCDVGAVLVAGKIDVALDLHMDLDAWLVNLDGDNSLPASQQESLEQTLNDLSVPVMFVEGSVPAPFTEEYSSWSRRLTSKLTQLAGHINLSQSATSVAKRVWVLAASTGGPDAVMAFLQQLPKVLPTVAFVYVQHIESSFENNLIQAINHRTVLNAFLAKHGDILKVGSVALIPAAEQIDLLPNGTFQRTGNRWHGAYSPSIDQVIANIANIYGSNSGVIVFSGMGDDGARGCKWLAQKGGKVWLQERESCTVASMVDSVIAQTGADKIDLPEELGRAFMMNYTMPKTEASAPH